MSDAITSKELRERFAEIWPKYDHKKGHGTALRVHRAITLVKRAEKKCEDIDTMFLYYWIAFNAAYNYPYIENDKNKELNYIQQYIFNVLSIDISGIIKDAILKKISDSIMNIIENRYIFRGLWDFYKTVGDSSQWITSSEKERFDKEKLDIQNALETPHREYDILKLLFERLYIMRCQFFHGSSSWNSPLNRDQVDNGVRIMKCLVPIFLFVMMNDPRSDRWNDLRNPRFPDIRKR